MITLNLHERRLIGESLYLFDRRRLDPDIGKLALRLIGKFEVLADEQRPIEFAVESLDEYETQLLALALYRYGKCWGAWTPIFETARLGAKLGLADRMAALDRPEPTAAAG